MKKFTKWAALAMAAAMLVTGCSKSNDKKDYANLLEQIKAEGKLIVATSPDYPPFEFEDLSKKGQEAYAGSDIEMARYIAEKLGVTLEIDPIAFEAVVTNVAENKAHLAISGLNVDPSRLLTADASDVYYGGEKQCVVTSGEIIGSVKTIEDLKGKTVAAQNGSIQLALANEQLKDSNIEMITTLNDGIMLLKSGKVDAVLMDSSTAAQFVKNYPELGMADMNFVYENDGFSIFLKKGEKELLDAVNEIIAEINEKDLYTTWHQEAQELSDKLGLN